MIKHTPHDHPDHGSLQLALGEIKTLADRMNRGEKEVDQAEREAERLRDLEATIEGMTNVIIEHYLVLLIVMSFMFSFTFHFHSEELDFLKASCCKTQT